MEIQYLGIFTGLNEHSGRYEYFINKLLEQKFAVYTMDHEGMGKSEGKRMWIDDWTNWVDDLQEYSKVCPLPNLGRRDAACRPITAARHILSSAFSRPSFPRRSRPSTPPCP
jgi:alpha-beta hydrolase superfamily lysophospholipase